MSTSRPTWKPSQPPTSGGRLRAEDVDALPDSAFAFPGARKEPMTDPSHVRNAIARFNQFRARGKFGGLASMGAFAALPSGVLSQGSQGSSVSDLQSALQSWGFSVGPSGVDGVYGPDTANAVAALQSFIGVAADGVYGPNTLNAINSHLSQLLARGGGGGVGPAAPPAQPYGPPASAAPTGNDPASLIARLSTTATNDDVGAALALLGFPGGYTGPNLTAYKQSIGAPTDGSFSRIALVSSIIGKLQAMTGGGSASGGGGIITSTVNTVKNTVSNHPVAVAAGVVSLGAIGYVMWMRRKGGGRGGRSSMKRLTAGSMAGYGGRSKRRRSKRRR